MTALNAEIVEVLKDLENANLPPLHKLNAEQARLAFQALRKAVDSPTPVHNVSNREIAYPGGNVPVRIYQPSAAADLPAIVWFHGGGWVLGDLESADLPCRDLAHHSGCTVISVDYRLAPEAPFPAAFDDSFGVTQWVANHSKELNINPQKLAVGGDSAGANLAACVAIAARDKGIQLAYQLLIYPVIEAAFDNQSYRDNAEGYFLTAPMMQWFWDQYVALPSDRDDSRVSPLRAPLAELPAALVLTVEFDPLRDEGIKYARALQAANVNVETVHVADSIHGCFGMDIKSGRDIRVAMAQKLSRALQ